MIIAILINNSQLRDALVSTISGVKQNNSTENILFYQKNNYIFAFSDTISLTNLFEETLREYQPEKVFIAQTARSIDVDHEIGDIILPNILFSFDSKNLQTEVDSSNRDSLIGDAQFLEIFEEQKDYFVEDFGLSVGGIIVENTPNDPEISDKLMTIYEADAYSENTLSEIFDLSKKDIIPTICIAGIVEGKIHNRSNKTPLALVCENLMTTIRLLNDEE